jgi:hypothetical protein
MPIPNIGTVHGPWLTKVPTTAGRWVPAVRYVNVLLGTFLVGLFVIALRRHFRQ